MAQYGRWIDLDGNLHYYDTEKGEVVEPKVQEPPLQLEYKIYIEPMPVNCFECPMCVDKGWGDLRDYCHLDSSINPLSGTHVDYNEGYTSIYYRRPGNCPLSTRRGGRAKIEGIIDDYANIRR